MTLFPMLQLLPNVKIDLIAFASEMIRLIDWSFRSFYYHHWRWKQVQSLIERPLWCLQLVQVNVPTRMKLLR